MPLSVGYNYYDQPIMDQIHMCPKHYKLSRHNAGLAFLPIVSLALVRSLVLKARTCIGTSKETPKQIPAYKKNLRAAVLNAEQLVWTFC